MTTLTPASADPAFPKHNRRRRDLFIFGLIGWSVLFGFFLTGTLSILDAGLAALVLSLAVLAYYFGSSPRRIAAPIDTARVTPPTDRLNLLLEETVAAISQPALLIDQSDRLRASNEGAQRLFQIRGSGQGPIQSIVRDPQLLEAIGKARNSKSPVQAELVRKRELEQVWQCDLAYIERATSVLIVLSDLSAVKRAERARADFLANASHELRTPLTSIAGFIETMQGPAADDKDSWDRFLSIMHVQTERMRRLITDLLSLSRIELDEHRPPEEQHDLGSIAEDVVDALRVLAAEKGLEIQLEKPDGALPVIAVRDELIQVVQNLTDNAMKYAPTGSAVRVSIGRSDGPDTARTACSRQWENAGRIAICSTPASTRTSAVWLRVEDSGPGIDPLHLPRLGERFYRADTSRGGKISGTGLGLAIVKHIMTRHTGGLAVESQPGVGSAFGIWLPITHPLSNENRQETETRLS
ncbi:MAG: ATP-binding protein [Pseudomonadota bacterium]